MHGQTSGAQAGTFGSRWLTLRTSVTCGVNDRCPVVFRKPALLNAVSTLLMLLTLVVVSVASRLSPAFWRGSP